jgi:hypothetical protein
MVSGLQRPLLRQALIRLEMGYRLAALTWSSQQTSRGGEIAFLAVNERERQGTNSNSFIEKVYPTYLRFSKLSSLQLVEIGYSDSETLVVSRFRFFGSHERYG